MDMKKYIDAQLQVVRIKNNDVIATSTVGMSNTAFSNEGLFGAPGQRGFDEWYEGY